MLASSLAAETYKFEISDKVKVGQTELKAGRYLVDVDGSKAVLKDKKGNAIEVKTSVEQAPSKVKATMLGMTRNDGVQRLESITLGGTDIKVKFE
jgi:CO dehydrogenase/acetyl-CoA synthase delta subunit